MTENILQTKNKDNDKRKNFICGVIEGFYGRPWTTEQRKDLFRKLKKWGIDSYVYAPKDDYKHRAYWRELYTVEEADHLSGLITAAKDHNVTFYYALSPGLDMTYSSQKELQTLKRKLDQVSQFGCEAFALLFDDIESELSKIDKEVFQTFGNAQVSVTNEIYTHLGNPKFLFCPTQYCSSRATPNVQDSEYLNTLGSKLNNDIDIMWTGSKVISKIITLESIQEITEVLRRPPVIWDNLHANDYDQKRVFLGPYSGRSPELIPHLRGVMTNPNCEFNANTIAIHTLASWSQCSRDSKLNSSFSADMKLETENEDGISSVDLPGDCTMSRNIYHPRVALKNAIKDWLPEFFVEKEAWGPISKPQPQVTIMPIIPIIPSVNTCMSLTSTTSTTSASFSAINVPEVHTTQLQALADVCSTVCSSSAMAPISNAVMNSLVSPTKVVTNDDILNPITTNAASNLELPKKIPISIVSVPIMNPKTMADVIKEHGDKLNEQAKEVAENGNAKSECKPKLLEELVERETAKEAASLKTETTQEKSADNNELQMDAIALPELIDVQAKTIENHEQHMDAELNERNSSPLNAAGMNEAMECSSLNSQKAVSEDIVMTEEAGSINEFTNKMQVESPQYSPESHAEMMRIDDESKVEGNDGDESKINVEDLYLLCDLFYLPFEHGSRATKLLNEFNWLKTNAHVLLSSDSPNRKAAANEPKPEVAEWLQRADGFSALCQNVQDLLKKVANCANKEICHDLFSYVWDVAGALTLLNAFVKWLSLAYFSPKMYSYTQGSYTWFSKGWKEAFMSGDQEPWVFRGGLTADLQRLIPVDSGDLFLYRLPEMPTTDYHILRPITPIDETEVNQLCYRIYEQLHKPQADDVVGGLPLPVKLRELLADHVIGAFTTLHPQLCIVAQDASTNAIVGYAAAAKDVSQFLRNIEICWLPEMREKYAKTLLDSYAEESKSMTHVTLQFLTCILKELYAETHYDCPAEVSSNYPAVITAGVLDNLPTNRDQSIIKRLLTVTLAALRANGCFGVHARVFAGDTELANCYTRIGFTEVFRDTTSGHLYLGRRF